MLKEEYEKLAQALHSLEHFCQIDCDGCRAIAQAIERADISGRVEELELALDSAVPESLYVKNRIAALRKRLEEVKEGGKVIATVSAEKIVALLLDQPWHQRCEIVPDYMPPYPRPDTRPAVVVRYNDGTEYSPMLRFNRGPKQGFGWYIHGDDMQTVELAVIALSQAPAPLLVFHLPLSKKGA